MRPETVSEGTARQAQALTDHPVQHQCHEADAAVRPLAFGEPVANRGDRDLGRQNVEATLDVGKAGPV